MDSATTDTGIDPPNDQSNPLAPADTPGDVDELRERLQYAEDQWRRAAADLDNVQKRYQRELARGQAAERERILGLWLATLDDLDRALAHAQTDNAAFLNGVEAIASHAAESIVSLGYPRFGEVGAPFDPELHEAVGTIPASDGAEPNTVVAVVKAGYGTAGRLLRPASVIVAKESD